MKPSRPGSQLLLVALYHVKEGLHLLLDVVEGLDRHCFTVNKKVFLKGRIDEDKVLDLFVP